MTIDVNRRRFLCGAACLALAAVVGCGEVRDVAPAEETKDPSDSASEKGDAGEPASK